MKRISLIWLFFLLLFSCKNLISHNSGSFILKNNSEKVIEFVWITEEGNSWPTAQSINVQKDGIFEIKGLKAGIYDIAIDFKDEYEKGKNNSKFDKNKCLIIEKGITKIWIIDEMGMVKRD